jgi:hypothetical protein
VYEATDRVADQFLVRAGTDCAALLGAWPIFERDGPLMPLEVERRPGKSQKRQTRANP